MSEEDTDKEATQDSLIEATKEGVKNESNIESSSSELQSSPISARYTSQEFSSGPIPSSSEMKGYEEALPGMADRIMKVFENQQEHNVKMEAKSLDAARWVFIAENILYWLFEAVLIGFGLYLLVTGEVIFGSGVGIIGVISVFLRSRKSGKKSHNRLLAETLDAD